MATVSPHVNLKKFAASFHSAIVKVVFIVYATFLGMQVKKVTDAFSATEYIEILVLAASCFREFFPSLQTSIFPRTPAFFLSRTYAWHLFNFNVAKIPLTLN